MFIFSFVVKKSGRTDFMNKITKILLALTFAGGLSGCGDKSSMHIAAVENFELERYLGKWYEICRLPNYFEDGMDNVQAEYTRKSDGGVKVVNSGIKNGKYKSISGVVRSVGERGRGELEVSFFRPFYNRYRIIRLLPDYSLAAVTGENMNYLWVLSRTPRK